MRVRKVGFLLSVVFLLAIGVAFSQTIPVNQLTIHNGGEFYIHGSSGYWDFPNHGGGKYYPSFTHWSASPEAAGSGATVFPWKLGGWSWRGMQANIGGTTWYWETCLVRTQDNPYSTDMSFDYPMLYLTGQVPVSGYPNPIYGGNVPTSVPVIGGSRFQFPSSMGGFDAYMNIFATVAASWLVPSTTPFYGVKFGVYWDCASAITVPSSTSIWEFLWVKKGPYGQYLTKSGDEIDCMGNKGNPCRNYSIISDSANGQLWSWRHPGAGVDDDFAFALFLCDAITIPVNVPGDPDTRNPFASFGFDVGVPCLMPKASLNCVQLGFMTEDYTGLGGTRIPMASMALWPCIGPFGKKNYRIPHGFDVVTQLFLTLAPIFGHTPAPGYPASMMGSTTGAHSTMLPMPADPALFGAEIRYSTYAVGGGQPMSASFMATYF